MKQPNFWSFMNVNRDNLAANLLSTWIPKLTGAAIFNEFWFVLGKPGGNEFLTRHYKGTILCREIAALKREFLSKRTELHSASEEGESDSGDSDSD
jgi:hypothetical protein